MNSKENISCQHSVLSYFVNLKEDVTANEFESFINNECNPVSLTVASFINLELLKKSEKQDTLFEQPVQII